MRSKRNFVLLLTLGLGLMGTAATAQNTPSVTTANAQVEFGNFNPGQSGLLKQAAWDNRRCDGDHDRDDRGCYYGYDRDRYYGYYSNGYAAPYYYAPPAGWYDRDGRWHAYDRDRDRDRRRYRDDDDRR